jgi:NAD(P)-dependent dehydrogenase (short-subunit alcohol dehydrogenase family)
VSLLAGRVALVTGASSGIGRSIAQAFAAEGATVVLAARGQERLDQVDNSIRQSGATALALATDVSREEQVVALFARTVDAFGRLDILVNNAGTAARLPTDEMPLAVWRGVLEVNLTGAFLCSREALKIMKRQRGGRIINIGSVAAKVPRPHSAPYAASKFALEGLTRSLALDGREHGIAASILHPGNVDSEFWRGREELARREGLVSPDDIARIVVLMASLPPAVNLLESLVLPVPMPFLGRG